MWAWYVMPTDITMKIIGNPLIYRKMEGHMKRFIASVLLVVMVTTPILTMSGCATKNDTTLSMGKWLTMVNSAFGMESYTSEEPYFKNVGKDDPYFATVQIATEWEVVDKNEELDVLANLKWNEALITLVNVGEFLPYDTSDEDKIQYAIDHFDKSIRKYWMKREIDIVSATILLAKAQEKWATQTYDTPIEDVTYAEGVKNYSQGDSAITDYLIQNNMVAIPIEAGANIEAGDIYVLPSNGTNMGTNAYKAQKVISDEKYIYIENSTEELELTDIAEDIYVENTITPTFENSVVRDGNGNIISVGNQVQQQSFTGGKYQTGNLLYNNNNFTTMQNVKSTSVSHEFEVGEWEIGIKYDLDGAFDFEASIKTPNLLDVPKSSNKSLNGEVSVGISDLEITNKIDYEWFQLKEAKVQVDYEAEAKFGLKYKDVPIDKVVAPKLQNYTGGYLRNFKDLALKDAKAKGVGAKTIKLASVDVYSIGVARLCLDINLRVTAEGTFEITVTEHGSKGIQYKNGNLRVIKVSDKDVDAEAKAKITGTVGIGPALYVTGLKKPIIGAQVMLGLGASASLTAHVVDSENHLIEEDDFSDVQPEATDSIFSSAEAKADAEAIRKIAEAQGGTYTTVTSGEVDLHFDVCFNVAVFFILKIEVTDTSYVAEILGGKIKTSWDICGEKNAKLFNLHIEKGNVAVGLLKDANKEMCTLKYTPFDDVEETEEENAENSNDTILKGDSIILGEVKANLSIGGKYYITVQQIPEGYEITDLVCSSSDEKVVTVNKDGVVKALGEGSAIITVSTKDGKYSACCAITVGSSGAVEIERL